MTETHYFVLIHKKGNAEAGDVLGFFKTNEEAEIAKANQNIPLHEMEIIRTDSTLQKI